MWPNPQEIADLVTFTEEIVNEKLQFLCSDPWKSTSAEAHRIIKCINLHFQFPKFRLVRGLTLLYNTDLFRGPKWKKLLLDWSECRENTTSIDFQFHTVVLNLVLKAILHFLSIKLDYVKRTLRNKQQIISKQTTWKQNHLKTKNINFQFHYRKFSQQSYSTLLVTREGSGRSFLFRKLEKSALIWGKSTVIAVIYGINFSFKMQFLSFSRRKSRNFSLLGFSFLCCRWNVYQSALISRNLPCLDKFLVTHHFSVSY